MLIRLPDDLFSKLTEVSDSLGKDFSGYLTEILEQAVRAYEFSCSLKDTVDLYERTVKEKKPAEEAELVEAPSVPEVLERMLASKLRPESESEERKILLKFLSQLSAG